MATDPDGCIVLIGLGINTLSMNPPLIPVIKKRLSEISMSSAKKLAIDALNTSSPEEVRMMIRSKLPLLNAEKNMNNKYE